MQKTRTISLRLSEQEFEKLKSLYAAHGARSISEFARMAMYTLLSWQSGGITLESKVREMDGKLSLLDSEVARLSRIVKQELAAKPDESNEKH